MDTPSGLRNLPDDQTAGETLSREAAAAFAACSICEGRIMASDRHPTPSRGKPARTSPRAKTRPEAVACVLARCPGCGRVYEDGSLHFLYSDEHGSYCHDCGSLLIECAGELAKRVRPSYSLVIPKGLAGSELHRRLKKVASKDGAPVLVAPSDAPKGVRLITAAR
jgi:hypothetical protein